MIDVLYDHEIFATQPIGGVSRYYAELLPRLREHGVAVDLFLGLHRSRLAFPRDRLARRVGSRRPDWVPNRLAAPINAARFRRHARRVGAQLYHATSYLDHAPDVPGPLRVVTAHDLTDVRLGDGRPVLGSPWSVSTAIARRVDGWICISEQTRRDLLDIYPQVDPARTCVIHHASDLTPDPRVAAPIDRPYVLFVGGRGSYKNFDGLCEAFSRSPRLSSAHDLVAFGKPPTPAERDRAGRSGIRVRFLGGDDAALAAAYAHARAFVYPSHYEGFGIPLLEAMHCDCPIVCSDASSFPEIAANAAELFDPRDPDAIAAAIERVVFDDARRAELIGRGRARAADFSWDRAAAQTSAFYRQILSAGRA